MEDKTKKIFEIGKQIASHKATAVSNVFNRVKISFYIFEANYNELNRWLKILENEKFLSERLNVYEDPTHANAYCDELARLAHNYFSSAFSLVDHTRNMIKELYGKQDFSLEYQTKLDATLTNNSLRRFIQDLRNYMMHRYFPNIFLYFQLNERLKCDVGFPVQELEDWEKWTTLSKEFLKNKKSILLKPIVEEHFKMVSEFYAWLSVRQEEIHKPEIDEVLKLVNEYNNLINEDKATNG
jgi:hypothetical protein